MHSLQLKPPSKANEAASVISAEAEQTELLSLLKFSLHKRIAASAQLWGGGVSSFLFFFFPAKLAFSVLTVNGNGSSFMKQMVFGVVTAMDLLTFVSRNDKK